MKINILLQDEEQTYKSANTLGSSSAGYTSAASGANLNYSDTSGNNNGGEVMEGASRHTGIDPSRHHHQEYHQINLESRGMFFYTRNFYIEI